jgi:hypothetical protein
MATADTSAKRPHAEIHLDLRNCLDDLVADGRLDRGDANILAGTTRNLTD